MHPSTSFTAPEIQTGRLLITSRRFVSCPLNTVLVRLNSAFVHDAIALAEHNDAGLPVLDVMFGDVGEAHDGEDVTSFSQEGSRTVEDDLARTGIVNPNCNRCQKPGSLKIEFMVDL